MIEQHIPGWLYEPAKERYCKGDWTVIQNPDRSWRIHCKGADKQPFKGQSYPTAAKATETADPVINSALAALVMLRAEEEEKEKAQKAKKREEFLAKLQANQDWVDSAPSRGWRKGTGHLEGGGSEVVFYKDVVLTTNWTIQLLRFESGWFQLPMGSGEIDFHLART